MYYYMKKRMGFADMTIKDALIMPFDRSDIDRRHGDSFIERGEAALEKGEFRQALSLFYSGTQKSPLNLNGKRMLAELEYQGLRRADFALRTLEIGVPYALEDLDYMRFYLSLLLKEYKDKRIIVLGNRLLENPEAGMDIKVFTAMTMATVYAMHGKFDKSSDLIREYGIDRTLAGILRLSKNEWEMGDKQAAIALARTAATFPNVDLDPINTLLMNYYLEMGDYASARSCVVSLRLSKPLSVDVHITYLKILNRQEEDALLDSEVKSIFDTVKHYPESLLELASYAADTKNVELIEQVYDYAKTCNYNLALFVLLRVETYLACEMYDNAEKILDELYKENPIWLKNYTGYFDCLYSVIYSGLNNNVMASIKTKEIIANTTIPPRTILATVRRLNNVKATSLAYDLLNHLVEKTPNYQLGLARLIEMEMEMGNFTNLDKQIYSLLEKRRPPRGLLAKLRYALDSDTLIFTADREKLITKMELFLNSYKTGMLNVDKDIFEVEDDDRIIIAE